jgi:hypothetical protein
MKCFNLVLSLVYFVFFPVVSQTALADEWKVVQYSLEAGEEVVLLPLPSEMPSEFLEEQLPRVQPELHFSGVRSEEGGSLAQAMLVLPPLSVGEVGENGGVEVTPFFALKGQNNGQTLVLAIEGGLQLSLGQLNIQLSVDKAVSNFSDTSVQVSGVIKF